MTPAQPKFKKGDKVRFIEQENMTIRDAIFITSDNTWAYHFEGNHFCIKESSLFGEQSPEPKPKHTRDYVTTDSGDVIPAHSIISINLSDDGKSSYIRTFNNGFKCNESPQELAAIIWPDAESSEIASLNKQIEDLRNDLQFERNQVAKYKLCFDATPARTIEILDLKNDNHFLTQDNQRLVNELARCKGECWRLERSIEHPLPGIKDKQITSLTKRLEQTKSENETLQNKVKELTAQVADLNKENDQLNQDCEDLYGEVEELQKAEERDLRSLADANAELTAKEGKK